MFGQRLKKSCCESILKWRQMGWFGYLVRMPPWGGMYDGEKTPGHSKDLMERLYLSSGRGVHGYPCGGAGGGG